jgi:type VI secretion system secreted protein Hcp
VAIYMKFGDVKGDVTTAGFVDWIELQSFQFAVHRNITSGASGAGRESTAPSLSDISISKHHDVSSTKLYNDALAGNHDTKVTIKMTTTTKNKTETYLTYELTDCAVSSYSQSSGGDLPMESLSLNYLKIVVTPTPLDKSGQVKKGDVVGYDLQQMKTS